MLSPRGLAMGHMCKARRIFTSVTEVMSTGTTRLVQWGEGGVCEYAGRKRSAGLIFCGLLSVLIRRRMIYR
jgi:hypothetical protein